MPQMYANLFGTYLIKWGFERKHRNNKTVIMFIKNVLRMEMGKIK